MRRPNKTRGEVALKLGGEDLILCAEMNRIEQLEDATGGLSLSQMMAALSQSKVSVVKAAVEVLTIDGDFKKAWSGQTAATEIPQAASAVLDALYPKSDDENSDLDGDTEGKPKAGTE